MGIQLQTEVQVNQVKIQVKRCLIIRVMINYILTVFKLVKVLT